MGVEVLKEQCMVNIVMNYIFWYINVLYNQINSDFNFYSCQCSTAHLYTLNKGFFLQFNLYKTDNIRQCYSNCI